MAEENPGIVGNVVGSIKAVVDTVGTTVGNAISNLSNSDVPRSNPGDRTNETLASSLGVGTKTNDGGVVVKDLITGEPSIIYPEGGKGSVNDREDDKDPKASDGGEDDTRDETINESAEAFQSLADANTSTELAQGIIDGTEQFGENTSLTNQTADISIDPDAEGTNLDGTDPKYNVDTDEFNVNAETAGNASTITAPNAQDATTYDASTVSDDITDPNYTVDPTTGEIRDENLINDDEIVIDTVGVATGINADGSINSTGVALANYATQNISHLIDTSTVSGKLLAEELGEGNYTDTKATVQGQLEILSKQFTDSNGNPIIPPWCAGTARAVNRTIAFTGVTGTAALAATCQALMEATLPIASEDASFFRTLTTKNLDNRQEAIINKANVLARFEESNLNVRETAAVNNAKAFLQMDLTNLDFENEAEVINKQARVDALFEDQKAENAQRLFTAQEQNDFIKYYDTLNMQAQEFNATAVDTMKRFNTGELNDTAQFNATMESQRERFYQEMQYNIDVANAKWRQNVASQNTAMEFEAASTDAKNMFDLSQEALNQIWDDADSMLDYAFKGAENEADRANRLAIAQLQASSSKSGGGFIGSMFKLAGAFIGTTPGSEWLAAML
tara:strand:+ start:44 stop:1912 length:1869 start_codon:yes stop_codon:yes gene_type:complete